MRSDYFFIIVLICVIITPVHAKTFQNINCQTIATRFSLSQKENISKKPSFLASCDAWFSPDKFDHMLGSAMLSSTSYLVLIRANNSRQSSLWTAIGSVVTLGFAKEVFDLYYPHQQSSWRDLTADIIGTFFGVFVIRSL